MGVGDGGGSEGSCDSRGRRLRLSSGVTNMPEEEEPGGIVGEGSGVGSGEGSGVSSITLSGEVGTFSLQCRVAIWRPGAYLVAAES